MADLKDFLFPQQRQGSVLSQIGHSSVNKGRLTPAPMMPTPTLRDELDIAPD
jgi:hypothetical protein